MFSPCKDLVSSFKLLLVAGSLSTVAFLAAPPVAQAQGQSEVGERDSSQQQSDRGSRGGRGDGVEPDRRREGRNPEGRGGRGGRGDGWDRRGRGGRPDGEDRQGRIRGEDGDRRGGPQRGLGLMGTPEGLFSPDYMTRDLPQIVAALALDDTQREIVAQLLREYDRSFGDLLDALREQTELIRDEYQPNPELEESMNQVRQSMQELRERARAQFGRRGRGGGDADRPETSDEMGTAEVSPEERQAQQQALREEFRQQFRDLQLEMEAVRAQTFASEEMQSMLDLRIQLIREFAAGKRKLRDSTVSGIRLLLLESQAASWGTIERTLRRQRVLDRGRLSGESTDLLDVFEDLEIDEIGLPEELRLILEAYELDLDRSLREREAFDYGHGLDLVEQLHDQDFEGAIGTLRKRLEIQEATRSTNDRYIELVSTSLTGSLAAAFRLEALRRGYGIVYRPTRGERAMISAMELEDLDPETLLVVAELMAAHNVEIADFNETLVAVLRAEEVNLSVARAEARMERMAAGRRGRGRDRDENRFDPVRDAFDDREEIDERYLRSLEEILGPERYEAVAGRRGRGRDRGGDDRRRPSQEELIRQFDANGDGELNGEERAAAREAMRARFRGDRERQGPGRPPREM